MGSFSVQGFRGDEMGHDINLELKTLVETIVRDLLENAKNIQKERKKVLFIFCDSSAHELFTDQFIQLNNEEINYDFLFLDGETSAWLGLHKIESTGSTKVIAADEFAPAPLELPKEYDAVVIPEIDLDNAARIALGLKGSIKAEIVFSALTLGKPVIIGEDVSGIKRSDRRTLKKLSLPPTYQKLFIQYKEDLKKIGIIFTKQESLFETILEKLKGVQTTLLSEMNKEKSFQGNVVTADWVEYHLKENDSLIVNRKVLITPKAKDILKEKQIDVKFV
jgi:hypothetical protein